MPIDKSNPITVLVSGVGGPAGINVVRLLKQRPNTRVIGFDIDDLSAGQSMVDTFLISPRVADFARYKQWLIETVTSLQPDIFIPTVDEELYALSTFVNDLSCYVPLSPTETLAIAADKLQSYEYVARRLPTLVPAFCTLTNWSTEWRADDEFFIKPRNGRGSRGCRVINRAELCWLQEHHRDKESMIVMEVLPGVEWTVDAYVSRTGAIAYLVPRERLGLAGGISIKGRTVAHEAVIAATKALLLELPCAGPVCVQWKQDKSEGIKFIEINPRFSGGLMITALAGIDPVAAIIADYTLEEVKEQCWSEITALGHFVYEKQEYI
jgi:carbamoyl-phosphate synthase large subunit